MTLQKALEQGTVTMFTPSMERERSRALMPSVHHQPWNDKIACRHILHKSQTHRNPETASLTKAMEKISRNNQYALAHLA